MHKSKNLFPFLLLIIVGLSVMEVSSVAAVEGSIVQVSRRLRMSAKDPIAPKDYYIDLGESVGVKIGDLFKIYRVIAVVNMASGYSPNLVRIPLGELKVILVGEHTSVGRLSARVVATELPSLDYPDFMLGDLVEPIEAKINLPIQQQSLEN